jgi:hypothetical protein
MRLIQLTQFALVPTIPEWRAAIQGCVNGIPEAAPIIRGEVELTGLEALARPTKTKYSLGPAGSGGLFPILRSCGRANFR